MTRVVERRISAELSWVSTRCLIDTLVRRIANDEFWERELMSKLSCAKTQHGSHIVSMPIQQSPKALTHDDQLANEIMGIIQQLVQLQQK